MNDEFRRLLTWMRLFVLGAFVALSAAMSLAVGGGERRLAAMLAGVGALFAVIAWRKLRPLLKASEEMDASGTAQGGLA